MVNQQGLSTSQVKQRLQECGFNELPSAKTGSVWCIVIEVVKEQIIFVSQLCVNLPGHWGLRNTFVIYIFIFGSLYR